MLNAKKGDATMKLKDLTCKNAEPREKFYRLTDGEGLYLEVMPNGSKYWRYRYRFDGKEKRLALGVYPDVGLKEAREKRYQARKLLDNHVDPSAKKKLDRIQRRLESANTFEKVAREWHEAKKGDWQPRYACTIINRLETDVFPEIGSLPIAEIKPLVLIDMVRKIERRGAFETTRRAVQYCSQIMKYATATGLAERDFTQDIKYAMQSRKVVHHPAIDVRELPYLITALDQNKARMYEPTQLAVKLMLLTFVRTNELIKAKWDEFDFEGNSWVIPAERMKMRKAHIVPLSRQSVELLERLKEYNRNRDWVFASYVKPKQHMSNNTILTALYRMGYKGKMTGHGFRALALTTLIEKLNYPFDVADAQLAHSKKHSLGAAYDRAQYLEQRKVMMQDWADYIDKLT